MTTSDHRRSPYEVSLGESTPPVGVRIYPATTQDAEFTDELLWMHGGAFVGGDLDVPEGDAVCRALAANGICCLAVDESARPPRLRLDTHNHRLDRGRITPSFPTSEITPLKDRWA